MLVGGALRAAISNALVHLHSQYYGKGPTRCRTHYVDDVIVVVMENILTTVERTLDDAGEAEIVRDVRLTFQEAMKDKFIATIEEKTGRRVKAFMSAVSVHEDTSVEVFTLEPRPDDEPNASSDGRMTDREGFATDGNLSHDNSPNGHPPNGPPNGHPPDGHLG